MGVGTGTEKEKEVPRKFTAEQLSAMVSTTRGMDVDDSSENEGDLGAGNAEVDLGNLLSWDPSPLDERALAEDAEDVVRQACTRTVTVLVHGLFRLPSRQATPGR